MKKQIKTIVMVVIVLMVISVFNAGAQPTFGTPTDLQRQINEALRSFPMNIAGNQVTIILEGDFWRGQVNGADVLAGEINIEETDNGAIITLDQSYAYVDTGRRVPVTRAPIASWVRTPGPQIVLEYHRGPPVRITRPSGDN